MSVTTAPRGWWDHSSVCCDVATSRQAWILYDSLIFHKHDVELGQYLLDLIYGHLWESSSGIMEDGSLLFTVVTHEYRVPDHHLEVGPFPYDFILSSVPSPFLRADEDIELSR